MIHICIHRRKEEQQKLLQQKLAMEEARKEEEGRDKYSDDMTCHEYVLINVSTDQGVTKGNQKSLK